MKNKILEFLQTFFQKYLLIIDIICIAVFCTGIALTLLHLPAGLPLLIIFAIVLSLYHLVLFGYMSKNNEQLNSLERSTTMLIGVISALLFIGIAAKLYGDAEKDKLLNIGLIFSILITAVMLLYSLMKSDQLNMKKVPFWRNILFCVAGIIIFMIPLKRKDTYYPMQIVPGKINESVIKSSEPVSNQDSTATPVENNEKETDSTQQ
jgi:hypothetical protein